MSPVISEQVIVYYFHSTVRCETCLFIETVAQGTLQSEFLEEMLGGTLIWRSLSVDAPENAHYIKDYNLGANELVVIRQRPEGKLSLEKITGIWDLVAEPDRLSARLTDVVKKMLAAK